MQPRIPITWDPDATGGPPRPSSHVRHVIVGVLLFAVAALAVVLTARATGAVDVHPNQGPAGRPAVWAGPPRAAAEVVYGTDRPAIVPPGRRAQERGGARTEARTYPRVPAILSAAASNQHERTGV